MAISERELEENEAKLDNILHKIIESSKKVQELRGMVNFQAGKEYNDKLLGEIDTLAKIIENLATLADEIDVTDERITKGVEGEIQDKLDEAITRINAVRSLLQQ